MRAKRIRFLGLLAVAAAGAAFPVLARAADPDRGKEIYESHCERCHGDDGRGLTAGSPDFARSMALMAPDADIVRLLRQGRGGMPAYEGLLRHDEFLDVIAYLRRFQP